MASTLQEIADAAATSYDFINNLIRRKLLSTRLGEAGPGVARAFTRKNALEIAFIAALVDIGRAPTEAAIIAADWLAKEARGQLAPWWVENSANGKGTFLSTAAETITVAGLAREIFIADDAGEGVLVSDDDPGDGPAEVKPATRIGVIHVAAIIDRIDALFDKARK
jgi:hypothetical protein